MSYLDGLIFAVEEGERGRVIQSSDGREAYEAKITLSPEGYEMLRTGLLCGRCLEDLRPVGAFPETCPTCNFRVRELQTLQLERDFVGEERLGPQMSLSDELERLGEMWIPGGD